MKPWILIVLTSFSLQSLAGIIDFSQIIDDTSEKTIQLRDEMKMGDERIAEEPTLRAEDLPIPPAQTMLVSKGSDLVFETETASHQSTFEILEAELDEAF